MPQSVKSDQQGSQSRRIWTYDEVCAEVGETTAHIELWDGQLEVMSPSPSYHHQRIVLNLYEAISQFLKHAGSCGNEATHSELQSQSSPVPGELLVAPLDVVLSPHQVVQPDLVYIAAERRDIIRDVIYGAPDWIIEVTSVGSRHRDRIDKKDLYEQYGVKEYWIVDPEPETIDVLTLSRTPEDAPGPYQLQARYDNRKRNEKNGSGSVVKAHILNGLQIPLHKIFPPRS